jgi:hypothetical protein
MDTSSDVAHDIMVTSYMDMSIACATSDDVFIYDVTTIACATSDGISIYDVTTISCATSDDIHIRHHHNNMYYINFGIKHGGVKLKTIKLVFAAFPLSTQHLGVRAMNQNRDSFCYSRNNGRKDKR